MSKVKEDSDGLFIQTGGHIFRPGDVNGYYHAYEMDDGGLKKGDDVKARHLGGSQMAKLKLDNGSVKYWTTVPLDHYSRIKPDVGQKTQFREMIDTGLNFKTIQTRYQAVAETIIAGHRYPLGDVQTTSYEDAALLAKTRVTDEHGPVEFIVIIGPESDMATGRSVRKYDISTLEEIRKR